MAASELFDSHTGDDQLDTTRFRLFFVTSPANTALNPSVEPTLPQKGSPLDASNPSSPLVDKREVVKGYATTCIVKVTYKRRTWGDIDIFQTEAHPSGVVRVSQCSPRAIDFQVLRVYSLMFQGQTNPSFNIFPETHKRYSEVFSVTIHLQTYGTSESNTVANEVGSVHSINGVGMDGVAIFQGADVLDIAKNLTQVKYSWIAQRPFQVLPERLIGTATIIETPEIEPHTRLGVLRDVQTGEPVYYQELPVADRPVGSASNLPGLPMGL